MVADILLATNGYKFTRKGTKILQQFQFFTHPCISMVVEFPSALVGIILEQQGGIGNTDANTAFLW